MGKILSGFVLPALLLTAAGLNWSLLSLFDLCAFLVLIFQGPKIGFNTGRWPFILLCIFILSLLSIISHILFYTILIIQGDNWKLMDSRWAELFGLVRVHSWRLPSVTYFLVLQFLLASISFAEIYGSVCGFSFWCGSWFQRLCSVEYIGAHVRVVCCVLLPVIEVVVGISHPSWTSFPFFICSCIGLVDWSLTSNFLGLFRWWRYLLLYSAFNIILLYIYQLPFEFSDTFVRIVELIGLYKICGTSEWSEICSSASLLVFYIMLAAVRCDITEMDCIMSTRESNLREELLPLKHSFFIHHSRWGIRHANVLVRGAVFRTFSINFFIYGFPISLLALSFWSFHFASLCAFGLLAYVGYILYAFPSMLILHRLNGMLLIFILLWAASTYIFNVAFAVMNKKLRKDVEIWETIGLWHYPIPGFYLLAQFCLGILVAVGNLVNNSVLPYMSGGGRPSDDHNVEDAQDMKVMIVATIAWGLRKSSRAIVLALIFPIATKPGFFHAVYILFFMMYLMNHTISRELRKSLVLLCEAHFALLYILRLNLISWSLDKEGSLTKVILSELGFFGGANTADILEIVVLACFCAIHNHGSEILYSLSAVVEHAPSPPIGLSILKDGLAKSVLLSVYTSRSAENQFTNSPREIKIATYLSKIGERFLLAYRSYGTYIAFLTILLTVYSVSPNFATFGYLSFLLLWMIGRQLMGKTKRRLWFPLKIYSFAVFVFIYCLSILNLETWFSKVVDLYSAFGYNKDASILKNIAEPLAVLVVMQLYSYERRNSKYFASNVQVEATDGDLSFGKRFLILHSEKILSASLLYASLSSISVFGCVYVLGLVISAILPKTSRLPSKFFLIYSGTHLMICYLFQMWGCQFEMLPGQKNSYFSLIFDLHVFNQGFLGLESGLRADVLVIVACIIQYNVFFWVGRMPDEFRCDGKWEEPCFLFPVRQGSVNHISNPRYGIESCAQTDSLLERKQVQKNRLPLSDFEKSRSMEDILFPDACDAVNNNTSQYIDKFSWEKENSRWTKKRIILLRKERLEMQKLALRIYLKFLIDNVFNLFGLEINMIALLLVSFAVLNSISLFYVALLATCIILPRHVLRKLWPIFVFFFASVLTVEYLAIWMNLLSFEARSPKEDKMLCCDCWRTSNFYFDYCRKCWLGIIVDDPRSLISYYIIFILASFKLRADRSSNISGLQSYREMLSLSENILSDFSFRMKGMWTFLDHVKLYGYCHLLDFVLALILVTGTLEYDVLHLGYLGFALVFFRMRHEILKKRNKIFKFLRMYNFALVVLSLAYQSPFIADKNEEKCDLVDYMFEIIGFYKYDYGFRITSRSAFVEIVIYMLVALQSYMFSSQEFTYISKYLEAAQIDSIVREQEKRAAWKTSQLQYVRKSEEQKRMRNFQVEKMKLEMLSLQVQLHSLSASSCETPLHGLKMRKNASVDRCSGIPTDEGQACVGKNSNSMKSPHSHIHEAKELMSHCELVHLKPKQEGKFNDNENPLKSAVHLIGDGVSQVQSLGNIAVSNLVSLLKIESEDLDAAEPIPEDVIYNEMRSERLHIQQSEQTCSSLSDNERSLNGSAYSRISMIFHYLWVQIQSNNDIVCYCCFVLIFLWNFTLLSVVYLMALFLYALCINTGPTYMFWVVMLIYTEVCILALYLYQILIQHCSFSIHWSFLSGLGFASHKIMSSFVISNWPLFMVYLFTLLQSSITAKDGEWKSLGQFWSASGNKQCKGETSVAASCGGKFQHALFLVKSTLGVCIRCFYRYWKSLTQGAETPPYFVQLSMEVKSWPEDGIQPERIESGINRLLEIVWGEKSKNGVNNLHFPSRIRVQSIERSLESPTVAIAVLEVLYASPPMHSSSVKWYQPLTPAADVAYEILNAQHHGVFSQIGFPYQVLSAIGGGRREIDLYAYTFCADLIVFFLVAIFYESVIKNKSEFLEVYQLEDQFPKEFVFILMIIFFLIVLDRIIYLCSFATGKVFFYLFNLSLFTYSVTKYAWYMEPSHQHAGRLALRAIYFTKAISLAFQAVQMKYGIPQKSTLYRQFLTSSISHVNFLGFRVYRALPFLHELRSVLDWSCTTTSLTMYDWLKLEDIHASLFLVKCDAELNRAKHQQGQKQTKMTKFCNGICLFFVLICVIWAPMLMYSSGNPTNIANPIKDSSVRIDIKSFSGRLTLFETTLCEQISWYEVEEHAYLDPSGYLSSYNEQDVQLICCQSDATALWQVPSAVLARFAKSLESNMGIVFSWQFTRDRPKGKELVVYELTVKASDLPQKWRVMEVLNGTTDSFRIYNIYPRYFRVTGSGDIRFLEQEVDLVSGDLVLNRGNPAWWSFRDSDALNSSACGDFGGPMAIVVSEETPQGILGETLSKFSIWGLYITFVLAVGRFIRFQCSDLRMRIPYEDLPSCDRLLAICEGIYAARAEGELEVEEVLYWTLVKIYRSPHMLLQYTKSD